MKYYYHVMVLIIAVCTVMLLIAIKQDKINIRRIPEKIAIEAVEDIVEDAIE